MKHDPTPRILIVDDNRAIHQDFRKILDPDTENSDFDKEEDDFFGTENSKATPNTFELNFATQGREAFELVRESVAEGRHFSLVFMDVRMPPGWDGIETTSKLWEVDPNLQIAICTAYSDYSWEEMVSKLDRTDQFLILKKPFDAIEARQCAHALTSKWKLLKETQLREESLEATVRERTTELIAARDTALESVRLKSRFLANMSHEIRTPMNGIIGMSDILSRTALNREQKDQLDTIRESADLLLHIINDILDSSKIESGKLAFEARDFNIHTVVEGAMDVISSTAREKGLEIACYTAADVFPFLRGDAGRLRQIITNILGNAVKFTSEGEVTFFVTKVHETEKDTRLRFEIKDTGIGISQNSIANIFEPFCQADDSNTRSYGGTGLGLTICRQIVEALEGQLEVHSEVGVGSTFWFEIRFSKQADKIPRFPASTNQLKNLKVLVVDDNATNRNVLQLQLANLGICSESVGGGREALAALADGIARKEPFNLAILDMQMPGMDGLELAGTISKTPQYSGTRLLLLSSIGDDITETDLEAAGISSYLVKPVKSSRLLEGLSFLFIEGENHNPATKDPVEPIKPVNPGSNVSRQKILLAEDNLVNQKVAKLQLRQLGYEADVANNGIEVLEALTRQHYDIILMDCQMPEMDGYTATYEIRSSYRKPVQILGMTANAMTGDRQKCLDAGMDDYISKPVAIHALEEILTRNNPPANNTPRIPPASLDTAPVAIETLMDVTCGDPQMFEEICNDYLLQAAEILNDMEIAIANDSSEDIRLLAHKLCGSSSTCGMNSIVKPLRSLEKTALSSDLKRAPQFHNEAWEQLLIIGKYLMFKGKSQSLQIAPPLRA